MTGSGRHRSGLIQTTRDAPPSRPPLGGQSVLTRIVESLTFCPYAPARCVSRIFIPAD